MVCCYFKMCAWYQHLIILNGLLLGAWARLCVWLLLMKQFDWFCERLFSSCVRTAWLLNTMFARNATQLARRTCAARTHLQVRSYAQSLRDRQLAHRKKLHEQRQREQEQAEQELAQQPAPATDIPEQRFELTKFNTRAINAGTVN